MVFWVPYRLTDVIAKGVHADGSGRATLKLVAGAALFILWIALLGSLAWILAGWQPGLASLVLLPVLALTTLVFLERSSDAWGDARRFLLLRSRATALGELRSRQRNLAVRLTALRERAMHLAG